MSDIFKVRDNIYNFQLLYSTSEKAVGFGTEMITCRGPQIWNLIPDNINNVTRLENFKRENKQRTGEKCPCRICKYYLLNIGSIPKQVMLSLIKVGSFLRSV